MNKIMKLFAIIATFLTVANLTAQDNPTSLREISNDGPFSLKSLNWRIYAGPEMSFLYAGDYSVMKGGKLGINAGIELNKSFGAKSYGILGLGVYSGGFERWVNNDPTVTGKSAFDQFVNLEIPVGLGFNFGKNAPKGFFTNFTVVNSITLNSLSNFTFYPLGSIDATSNVENGTLDKYNIGGRVEFGVKTKIEGNSYSSFSLSAKTLFLNRFSTNTNQYTALNIAANLGFYF